MYWECQCHPERSHQKQSKHQEWTGKEEAKQSVNKKEEIPGKKNKRNASAWKSENRSLSQRRHSYSTSSCVLFSSSWTEVSSNQKYSWMHASFDGTPNAKYKTFFSSLILINLKYGIIFEVAVRRQRETIITRIIVDQMEPTSIL